MAQFQGIVEELGMSIFMQGSHQLMDEKGQRVALLQATSDSVDLSAYVGQKVEVSGTATPSVEGGATFVNVDSVRKV